MENLDTSTSPEGDSYLTSDLDLLNPRVTRSARRTSRRHRRRSDKEADIPNLLDSAAAPSTPPRESHNPVATKLLNRKDQSQSPARLREENSKSSVVVLYHGKSPTPPSSARSPVRPAKSEQTVVRPALSHPIGDPSPSRLRLAEPPKEDSSPRAPLLRKRTAVRRYRRPSRRQEPLNVNIFHESRVLQVTPQEVGYPSSLWTKESKLRRGLSEVPGRIDAAEEDPGDRLRDEEHRRTTRKSLRASKERCRPHDPSGSRSRQMAHRSNARREGTEQSQQYPRGGPDLGFLTQHMQNHHRATGDNRAAIDANGGDETKRVFPFQATPSGNLKIIPNQVVFESKKVSVLVADPRHTKVNVKADLSRPGIEVARTEVDPGRPSNDLPPGVSPSTIDQLQAQQKLPQSIGTRRKPRTQPHRSQHRYTSAMEQQPPAPPANHRVPPANEVPLSSLGFTGDQPIDWENIILPEKTDLYDELARRITNYKNADCIVRLDRDEFHCHLLVLQSYSAFFDEKNCKEVDLSGSSVTSKAFSVIYDWMIGPTRESCHLLRRDNILEIFTAAQYLGIRELEEQCWAFIDNDELFSEDTAFQLYLEARKIGNTAVMELMIPRIMKFFLMLVSTKDFLELSMEELCLLLRSNYICVNSEMEVLMSAVRWLMHDWEERRQHLLDVMKCVRFGLIAPWQLVDVKRNPENPEFMELVSYPEIQKMVDDGLAFVIIKYWYGNQTEDYYHWIDLLGLTEPTNRNWAGEDKNYVTYREFLLYLEEYQKTKISEFKSRGSRAKPTPPNSPPKDSPPSPPPNRTRANYPQNHCTMDVGSSGQGFGVSNNPARGSKYPQKSSLSPYMPAGMPAGMAMPPEALTEYLKSVDRDQKGGKPVLGDGESVDAPTTFHVRLSGGGDPLKKLPYNAVKGRGRIIGESCRRKECNEGSVGPRYEERGDEKMREVYYHQQWEPRYAPPTKRQQRRCEQKSKLFDDRGESSKSEEEAATAIQAMYRGYKARRRYDEIRRTSSEEQQNARKVAELLAIPVGQNLHAPLEPVKVTGPVGRGRNDRGDAQSPRKKSRQQPAVVGCGDKQGEEDRPSSAKDLEGLRFDTFTPQPTPRSRQKSRPTDLPLVNSSTTRNEVTKPIQTIKSAAFFHRCDERTSSISPTDHTDTDDPFSPRTEGRSVVELQTRESIYRNPKPDNTIENICQATSEHQPRPRSRSRDVRLRSSCDYKRLLPQHANANVTGVNPDNFYLENSLFFPEREAVLVFGGIDPHEEYGSTGNTGKDVYRFVSTDNAWEFVGEIPEPRHHHSVVYLRGRVYLVGGADPREDDLQRKSMVVGTVWSYDPTTRAWFSEPGMLTPRKNFGLVVSHGKMYAMGGQDRNGVALRTVEAFDPIDSTWREMQPMYTARVGPASTKYRDLIWIAGGMTKSKKDPLLRDVECYDPLKNLWLKAEPLRSPRCFASMYVISNCLYVIGGAGKTSAENITESMSCVDIWDPNLCVWRQQAEMSVARHGHSTGSIGDQLLIMGGVTTVLMRTLKSVECYNCERDKWTRGISALPYAISGHGTVSLPAANLLNGS